MPLKWVTCHLLVDHSDRSVVLVDGGFARGAIERIETSLVSLGLGWEAVQTILLTHGHLDHTLNLAELRRRTGAPLLAPRRDRDHLEGIHPYRGPSRIGGAAEWLGRRLFRYEVPEVDRWIEGGDHLSEWGGLEAVALPGHTAGHLGFLSRELDLLIAGDLFSHYRGRADLPPPWFNVDGAEVRESVIRADRLISVGGRVVLNHATGTDALEHRQALRQLAGRLSSSLTEDGA